MGSIADYLLRIVSIAILCGVFLSLTEKGPFAKPIRLLSGLILTVALVKPVLGISQNDLEFSSLSFKEDAVAAVSYGQNTADQILDSVITERLVTYIEDKAEALGADITVTVSIRDHEPDSVSFIGRISPYTKSQLSRWITTELGIPEEAQYWN